MKQFDYDTINPRFSNKDLPPPKDFNHGKFLYPHDGIFEVKLSPQTFKFNKELLSSRSPYFKKFIEMRTSDKPEMQNTKFGLQVYFIDEDPQVLEKILEYLYGDKRCVEFTDYEVATRVFYAAQVYGLEVFEKVVKKSIQNQFGFRNHALNRYVTPYSQIGNKIRDLRKNKFVGFWHKFELPKTESELKAMLKAALPDNPEWVLHLASKYYGMQENIKFHMGTYPLQELAHMIPWERFEEEDEIRHLRLAAYPLIQRGLVTAIKLCNQGNQESRNEFTQRSLEIMVDRWVKNSSDSKNMCM